MLGYYEVDDKTREREAEKAIIHLVEDGLWYFKRGTETSQPFKDRTNAIHALLAGHIDWQK